MDSLKIKKAVEQLLEAIGEDKNREGLKETPIRVARAYEELFDGYSQDVDRILNKTFEISESQMVIWKNIQFTSFCEHHILPFNGFCHIGYIPNKKVIGLSKFIRLVNCFAHRLQIQEELTGQIARAIFDKLKPEGVGVVIEAKHDCARLRGVKNNGCSFVTTVLLGSFRDDAKARQEFLSRINQTYE